MKKMIELLNHIITEGKRIPIQVITMSIDKIYFYMYDKY